jgi:hypothetical protein
MTYKNLLEKAKKEGIEVIENCKIGRLEGLYIDNIISLSNKLETAAQKKCVLGEELGHYYTTYGNIINQDNISNIKQEKRARAWAYQKLISFKDLIKAFEDGVKSRYQLSIYLEVTEEFLINGMKFYKRKYGSNIKYKNYYICFEPLGVLKRFKHQEDKYE